MNDLKIPLHPRECFSIKGNSNFNVIHILLLSYLTCHFLIQFFPLYAFLPIKKLMTWHCIAYWHIDNWEMIAKHRVKHNFQPISCYLVKFMLVLPNRKWDPCDLDFFFWVKTMWFGLKNDFLGLQRVIETHRKLTMLSGRIRESQWRNEKESSWERNREMRETEEEILILGGRQWELRDKNGEQENLEERNKGRNHSKPHVHEGRINVPCMCDVSMC